jgi:hypothetical protein
MKAAITRGSTGIDAAPAIAFMPMPRTEISFAAKLPKK